MTYSTSSLGHAHNRQRFDRALLFRMYEFLSRGQTRGDHGDFNKLPEDQNTA